MWFRVSWISKSRFTRSVFRVNFTSDGAGQVLRLQLANRAVDGLSLEG
jgi:hypothetical protein